MSPVLYSVIGGASMLLITSIYRLAESGIRKRVTVRSPEMKAVLQLGPAMNMTVPVLGALLTGQQATLEALQGQRNGNVDKALTRIDKARSLYDNYLIEQAEIEGME